MLAETCTDESLFSDKMLTNWEANPGDFSIFWRYSVADVENSTISDDWLMDIYVSVFCSPLLISSGVPDIVLFNAAVISILLK